MDTDMRRNTTSDVPGESPAENQRALSQLAGGFLCLVLCVMAALTVLTHSAQIGGLSFRHYAWLGAAISLCLIVAALWKAAQVMRRTGFLNDLKSDGAAAMGLLAACVAGTLLGIFCYRTDTDDAYYAANAVYYYEHPDEPMGFKIHFVDSGDDKPFVSYHFGSIPFECSQAAMAWLLRLHFLDVYHVLAPGFFGFLIPLTWFYLITRFSYPTSTAVAAAFLICLSLPLMGEQPRSVGNYSFNRIFQGKTVMFAVLLPLMAAWTMDFIRSPSVGRWMRCLLLMISGVGLTTCAAVLLPMVGSVLAPAAGLAYVGNLRKIVIRGCCYAGAFIYPLSYAITFLLLSSDQFDPIYETQRYTFAGHAAYVLKGPVTNTLIIGGTVMSVLLLRKENRRFIIAWICLLIVLYLNPLSARFLTRHVTSPAIYYRVFMLYPFPLVLGLAGAAVALWLQRFALPQRLAVYGAVAVLLALGHLPRNGPSIFRQQVRPTRIQSGYKVWNYSTARAVVDLGVPPGTMLALPDVCYSIGTITSAYPQMRVKRVGIEMWLPQRGKQDEIAHRIRASEFLGGWETGDVEEAKASLTMLLGRYSCIRSVAAMESVVETQNLDAFLRPFGFTEFARGKPEFENKVVVFTRPLTGATE
jgi:hypothetical protein